MSLPVMLKDPTASPPHACGGDLITIDDSASKCDLQTLVEDCVSCSAAQEQLDARKIPTSPTTLPHKAMNPLGGFSCLPRELRKEIWSALADCSPPAPNNKNEFDWPEECDQTPDSLKTPTTLLTLMLTSKAMRADVYSTLESQMKSKTFNLSFNESFGVRFESIRSGQPVSEPDSSYTSPGKSSVCPNIALSAFASALPFIRHLNITILLVHEDLLFGKQQSKVATYVKHASSILSNIETTAKLEALNTNVRLHVDCVGPWSGNKTMHPCPATMVGAWMADAIVPLYRLARSRVFLGDWQLISVSDKHMCSGNSVQYPPGTVPTRSTCLVSWIQTEWATMEEAYFTRVTEEDSQEQQ